MAGAAGPAKLRRAGASDRALLLGLWLDLIGHHRRLDPEYPGVGGSTGLAGIREALLREIARGVEERDCTIWLAELDGEASGFLFAELERRPGEPRPLGRIHELYVSETSRRRGIGSALVGEAESWLSSEGAERVQVRVERANADGLRFWDGRGFDERSRTLERRLSG